MDLGSNFAAKLEPFLLIAKSVKGAAAAKLIQDATSAPGVFVFSELLEFPNIQELGNHDKFAKHLSLLQLFAYRTYQDYSRERFNVSDPSIFLIRAEHKDDFPLLNKAQITKLKHLSIVTLASASRILPYSELLKVLDMPNVRELEDLIIDAIYLDILRGKLDQKEGQLEIEYTMGRDLEPGKLESILSALQDWSSTTASVLGTLDVKISDITKETALRKSRQIEYDSHLQAQLKEIVEKKERQNASRRAQVDRDHAPMDIDEPPLELAKGRNRKATHEANHKLRKRNKI